MKLSRQQVIDRCMEIVEADEMLGICISCGAEKDGCEPDARRYTCDECGKPKVYGAEEILLHLVA
jgi:hypothetical protein